MSLFTLCYYVIVSIFPSNGGPIFIHIPIHPQEILFSQNLHCLPFSQLQTKAENPHAEDRGPETNPRAHGKEQRPARERVP